MRKPIPLRTVLEFLSSQGISVEWIRTRRPLKVGTSPDDGLFWTGHAIVADERDASSPSLPWRLLHEYGHWCAAPNSRKDLAQFGDRISDREELRACKIHTAMMVRLGLWNEGEARDHLEMQLCFSNPARALQQGMILTEPDQ